MPNVIVVGAQWGDEGKGKIIDLLAPHAKHIVRSQGGNNAGHTIVIGDEEYKLHLIPSGILSSHTQCYICAGTVIDPEVLTQEIKELQARGADLSKRLWISPHAHLILPYHKAVDAAMEKRKGKQSIGTTGRGIGPCYCDKANRLGIKMGEFVRPDLFTKALRSALSIKNEELTNLFDTAAISFEEIYEPYHRYAEFLKEFVADVEEMIHSAALKKENMLFEGAQGTFLDLSFGTYPFVTSSNTIAAGICCGAGIGPKYIDHTLGVVKAYTTRVGNGPFPSEVKEAEEQFLNHEEAREVGTTTGRKRRVGWFDAVLVKAAVRLNGLDSIAITKLDILDKLEKIKICVGYKLDGKEIKTVPALVEDFLKVEPIYETMPGWHTSLAQVSSFKDLPQAAKNYLKAIEELVETPISIISTGPERHRTIVINNPLSR